MSDVKHLMLAQDRIKQLEDAIREHRAQKADDRCIEDDDRLYAVLKDGIKCDRRVGSKEEMLKNCARFIDRRCQQGYWPTYAEMESQRDNGLKSVVALLAMLREVEPRHVGGADIRSHGKNCVACRVEELLSQPLAAVGKFWLKDHDAKVSSDATLRERLGWIEGLAKVDVLGADVNDERVARAVKEHDKRVREPLRKMVTRLSEYAKHAEYPEGDPPVVAEAWDLLRDTENP